MGWLLHGLETEVIGKKNRSAAWAGKGVYFRLHKYKKQLHCFDSYF